MKTEKEIMELYGKMVESEKKLREILDAPPTGMNMDEINKNINDINTQCMMNDLIRWVLDKESP